MGWGEIIAMLVIGIIVNIWLWSSGFYSKRESGDPNAYKKTFIVNGKTYRFSREDLSDEERAKEMANVALDEFFGGEEKD